MELNITHPDPQDIDLYTSAFPPEERRPVDMWEDLFRFNRAIFMRVSDNGNYIGFITLWKMDPGYYVEHFATIPELRGKGYGERILSELARKGFAPLILEVEPQDLSPLAKRRVNFYQRCGFSYFPSFDYTQPSYAEDLPEVKLVLMSTDPNADLPSLSRQIIEEVYKPVHLQDT